MPEQITKKELIEKLLDNTGGEEGHIEAVYLLLQYINDPEVTEAYNNIPSMWYA